MLGKVCLSRNKIDVMVFNVIEQTLLIEMKQREPYTTKGGGGREVVSIQRSASNRGC